VKIRHPRIRERVSHFFAIDTDRPLYTHGPIVRVALICVIGAALMSCAALAFALRTYSNRLNNIQQSRVESATDTCRTLRTVISQAYKPQQAGQITFPARINGKHVMLTLIIPKTQMRTAASQIKADHLANCRAHALKQTRVKH
jgi:hypothetical protein